MTFSPLFFFLIEYIPRSPTSIWSKSKMYENVKLRCISPISARILAKLEVGTSNRTSKHGANGKLGPGGTSQGANHTTWPSAKSPAFTACSYRCGYLLHSISFPGPALIGTMRQLLYVRKSLSSEVRRDASKTVHRLANIDPSGTASASRNGIL